MKKPKSFFGSMFGRSKQKDDSPVKKPDKVYPSPGVTPSTHRDGVINVGDRIGGRFEVYQIHGGEGKSGMGVVYVCFDHESNSVYALKTFQNKYLTSEGMKNSFKREALAWTHLERHPYIVRAIAVQELDHRLYILLEYIAPDEAGRNTLTQYLQSPTSLKQALTWSIQFCYGMKHAEDKGITPHRDIKPDNIMITSDGTVKITDFGLARMWDEVETIADWEEMADDASPGLSFLQRSDGKAVAGTPPWMAPEQFEGNADIRSDIYAFGIILYQMVNRGRLPFSARGVEGYKKAHKSATVPQLDTELSPVIKRCLEKKPDDRYQDFEDLRRDIEKLYREETGEAPPTPPEKIELEAWERCNKGASFHSLGLFDDAIREFGEALRIKPDDADAHNNLGVALKDKGLLDSAIRAYREALRINPDFAEAHNNLGAVFCDKGLFDDAIEVFENFIKYAPPQYAQQVEQARQNIKAIRKMKGVRR